jgi:type II secretory ATPase GspE/PulE/Tfp pilus assembly ATPase PilB-like protein
MILDIEKINNAVKNLIKQKTQWDDTKVNEFFIRTKMLSKSIYEMICEIEGIASYTELAREFSEVTGIPFAENIYGEIKEIMPKRHIKVTYNGSERYYIWHPLAVKGIPEESNIYLLSMDLFVRLSGISWDMKISQENVKNRLLGILKEAVRQKATDVHLYPIMGKDIYRLAFRILGDLHDIDTLEYDTGKSLISLIINWAKQFTPSLRVDDIRRPQDARIEVTKDEIGTDLDIRVSIIWKHNLKDSDIVLRLLYKTELTDVSLEGLGFCQKHSQILNAAISRNRGIIIVTGATGTGKSKTVNTLLSMVSRAKNVLTVEDPIEYILPHGRQFQTIEWEDPVERKVLSTSFSEFARAFKRHDPDVIFIGELRDKKTVDTAMHLAKTGHLVFGTLHASRATMIPEILVEDYDISRDVVADNLLLGVNQILVKRLCDKCKIPSNIERLPEWMNALRYTNVNEINKLKDLKLYFANKSKSMLCECAMFSQGNRILISKGYSGRTLLAEVFELTPEFFSDNLISSYRMEEKLIKFGNILTDAIEKVQAGIIEIGALKSLL